MNMVRIALAETGPAAAPEGVVQLVHERHVSVTERGLPFILLLATERAWNRRRPRVFMMQHNAL
jgi:hypothetical protein